MPPDSSSISPSSPQTIFFFRIRPPATSTLFPYTTLFRSLITATGGAPSRSSASVNRRPRHVEMPKVSKKLPETYSPRSEEHTSELQSRRDLVCRLLLEKKKK